MPLSLTVSHYEKISKPQRVYLDHFQLFRGIFDHFQLDMGIFKLLRRVYINQFDSLGVNLVLLFVYVAGQMSEPR